MDNGRLTQRIIGAAISVHRELGPGFVESIYEKALAVEFKHVAIEYEEQKPVSIRYRGQVVGEHRLDFLVEKTVIVENKAVASLDKVFFVILRSYLKAMGLQDALLFNFSTMPLTIKRIGPEDAARYLHKDNPEQ
jgi:GxxExxY protein